MGSFSKANLSTKRADTRSAPTKHLRTVGADLVSVPRRADYPRIWYPLPYPPRLNHKPISIELICTSRQRKNRIHGRQNHRRIKPKFA